MPKLLVSTREGQVWTTELNPGLNTVGRAEDCDLHIGHPMVSGHHCQIVVAEQTATVRDLGSTNGTFIDGQRITEGTLIAGQTLRVGTVELRLDLPPLRIAIPDIPKPEVEEPTFQPDGSPNCLHHPGVLASEHCPRCDIYFCEACVTRIRKVGGDSLILCPGCSGQCEQLFAQREPVSGRRKKILAYFKRTVRVLFK